MSLSSFGLDQPMPGSFVVFDSLASQLAAWIAPQSAIDIGAGGGKFGHVLKNVAPNCKRVAVEPELSYVERYSLRDIYDEVHVESASQWQYTHRSEKFDLAILGSCLPQMAKSAGLDLLNFLVNRTAYVLIIAPEFLVQGAVDEVEREAHVSIWSERDFEWHPQWAYDNCRASSLFLLKGNLASPVRLEELVSQVNSLQIPIHEFNELNSFVRPARLRLVEIPRAL